MIAGKLEVAIKIKELPQPKTIENGWQQFDLDCDGRIITITVKPKIYKKLTNAASNSHSGLQRCLTTSSEASTLANSVSKQTTGSCCRNPISKFSSVSLNQRQQPLWCCLSQGNHTLHTGATNPRLPLKQSLTNVEVTSKNQNDARYQKFCKIKTNNKWREIYNSTKNLKDKCH